MSIKTENAPAPVKQATSGGDQQAPSSHGSGLESPNPRNNNAAQQDKQDKSPISMLHRLGSRLKALVAQSLIFSRQQTHTPLDESVIISARLSGEMSGKGVVHGVDASSSTDAALNELVVISAPYTGEMPGKDIVYAVDASWSTDSVFGMRGWIFSKSGPVDQLEISVGNSLAQFSTLEERPDVALAFPQYPAARQSGFVVEIPHDCPQQVVIRASAAGRQDIQRLTVQASKSVMSEDSLILDPDLLMDRFVDGVNADGMRVLEIGSRIVVPDSSSLRVRFPGAKSYTGFDCYPDSNTDVVGDAHHLASYFPGQKFDAVFSRAVFEHLAMPWLVTLEIAKLLEVGGLTLHITHQSWPLHELPADYWRFSDQALKVLFSPAMGFEVLEAGHFWPLSMYLHDSHPKVPGFSACPAFGGSAILARKVKEFDPERFRWDTTITESAGPSRSYPQPKGTRH